MTMIRATCRIQNIKEKLIDLGRRDKCCPHHPKDMTSSEYGGTPLEWIWNFNPGIKKQSNCHYKVPETALKRK